MALNATVGSASADSFVSVSDADAYIDTRLNVTAWTGASTPDKERALKSATRELNLLAYLGTRVDTTQALAWPREGCPNPDASGGEDAFYGFRCGSPEHQLEQLVSCAHAVGSAFLTGTMNGSGA